MRCFRTTLLLLAAGLTAATAATQEYTAGTIKVSKVWTREVPGGAKVAAGFMTITNTGQEPDMLIGGSVSFAGKLEVHKMSMDAGMMRMRRLDPGLAIKPGETVVLRPGSLHLMFLDLKTGPKRGTPVKGTLIFKRAGRVEVEYEVAPVGAREPGGKQSGGHHDMHNMKPKGGSHGKH